MCPSAVCCNNPPASLPILSDCRSVTRMEQGDETHIPLGEWGTSTKSYNIIHALREVWRKDPRSTEDSEPNYMWGKEFCKIQNCQEETTVWVHLNKNHGWLPLNLISQRALCVFLQTFPLGCILQHIYPSFEFDCYNALLREIFFFFFFFCLKHNSGKESACQSRRLRRCGFDPWTGKSKCPGGANDNPLQCSYLENPMQKWAWHSP